MVQYQTTCIERACKSCSSKSATWLVFFHLLKQLHWLPVEWRIKFKIARLTFKVLETGLPSYLSQQLRPYVPTRGLRSSLSKLLQVPRTNLRFGSRSFRVSAVCTHHMELNSPQCSFLRISNNVSETSQNTLFSICIFCRPPPSASDSTS